MCIRDRSIDDNPVNGSYTPDELGTHTLKCKATKEGYSLTKMCIRDSYSAGFTLDTYAHVTTDAQLKAAQTMGNILSRAV